ncbi:MAG UNVERIFIED_CONTAM: hypothetical protein LVR18_46065 [Planctomycetaceae bacterium]
MNGRAWATHADVQTVCHPVLGHRLILRPESELDGRTTEQVIQQLVRSVPVVQESGR